VQANRLWTGPLLLPPFFCNFCSFLIFYFWYNVKVWRWAWHFGRMGVHHFHFLNLAPTLGQGCHTDGQGRTDEDEVGGPLGICDLKVL
jgi:hypothetical protein